MRPCSTSHACSTCSASHAPFVIHLGGDSKVLSTQLAKFLLKPGWEPLAQRPELHLAKSARPFRTTVIDKIANPVFMAYRLILPVTLA